MNQRVDPDDLSVLLRAVREGEKGAFEKLLDLYRPLLVSTVASFGEMGGVMMQEATIALYRAALAYRGERGTTFGLFAKICVTNALTSALRREKRREGPLDEESGEGPGTDPEDLLIYAETVKDFYRLSTELLSPFELKTVILRADGYSNREIADILKKSEKSVANALGRAMKKIRERYTGSAL
ncbi:MAG: sigma-70 family RNA polymerase sigma factor [Clostridia bacterium]|nr:sigma-70 family RNA polymerase sigma factor [Clostridia bacterium]